MGMLNGLFRLILGFSSGLIIAGSFLAFLSMIGIIPRIAAVTKTMNCARKYEDAIVLGAVLGNLLYLYEIHLPLWWIGILLYGFFGGFFVVCYAQIKELFPISMAGTSTAAFNLFPFAGGALFTIVGGLIVKTEVASGYLGEYRTLWLLAVICMLIATFCAFISVENKADIKQ